MFIENKFELGATVYLITDKDQCPRIIRQLSVSPGMYIQYELVAGTAASWHNDCEISETANVLLSTAN